MIFHLENIEKAFVFQRLFLNGLYRIFVGKEAITGFVAGSAGHLLYRIFVGKEAITCFGGVERVGELYRIFVGKEAITLSGLIITDI